MERRVLQGPQAFLDLLVPRVIRERLVTQVPKDHKETRECLDPLGQLDQ